MSSDPGYSRVYRYILDDPKFKGLDKESLGWWLELLLIADSLWPESAPLPYGIKETCLAKLTERGIVTVDSDTFRYRIKGLDKERAARSKQAQEAANHRWNNERHAPAPADDMRPHSDRNATGVEGHMPRQDETRQDETSNRAREGLVHITDEVQQAVEDITGRGLLSAGDKQLTELDRLVEDHQPQEVIGALRAVANGQRMTARQLIWGTMKVLEPFPTAADVKEAEEDQQARRRWEASRRHIESLRAAQGVA